jgi:hypothetical protein
MPNRKGICVLCGKGTPLTFEHVPARSSFNVPNVIEYRLDDWLQRDSAGRMPGGYIQPKGTGAEVFCKPCNEFTGSKYVPYFSQFVDAGRQCVGALADRVLAFNDDPEVRVAHATLFEVRRLAVLKQIVTMVLAVNSPELAAANPALRRFVLDRDRVGLAARYRFYVSLNFGPMISRSSGVGFELDVRTGLATVITEVLYVPFAYLMTIDAPVVAPKWSKLAEITAFANVPYDDVADVDLSLPIGFAHTALPGDYRSSAAIAREAKNVGAPESPSDLNSR